jgi:arylformamidase
MKHRNAYDITTLLGSQSIDYPGDTPYVRTMLCSIGEGAEYDLARLEMSAHSGTHLDAPAHFVAGGKTIDQYAVNDFILPAHVIHIGDPEAVRPSEIPDVDIVPGEAILFRTQSSGSGRCTSGAFSHGFVYLSPEVADLCVEKRVHLVGLDSISVDRYGDEHYPVHHRLSEAGILILEGIDLAQVPAGRYTLICLPLRIRGGEASPARAVLLS